ncbi:hypothetical protein [Streptomyces sp. NBC_00827]|uniref:hypothetical protein n=1 Tax=Streptomyces sp. NBC_00827 TaxID=2903677 RepID=UPI00386F27A9|nr:hypothetical protein OG569_00295 [Streptomyces sp. NBC_00827]
MGARGLSLVGGLRLVAGEAGLFDAPQLDSEWQDFLSAVLLPWRDKHPEAQATETLGEDRATGPLLSAASRVGLLVIDPPPHEAALGRHTGAVTHAMSTTPAAPWPSSRTTDKLAAIPHI